MFKMILFLLVLLSAYGNEMTARFLLKSDPKLEALASIPIKSTWWSRPSEYAWAIQFAEKECTVLDAACGISHPFKWQLGNVCKATYACDLDSRISSREKILRETFDDLGLAAYQTLSSHPEYFNRVKLLKASICDLPKDLPPFDRIFCISTLEHMKPEDQKKALSEFARCLAPQGLLVVTIDYPLVQPATLISYAKEAGLVPASDVDLAYPKQGALTGESLSIFRCVFVTQPACARQ